MSSQQGSALQRPNRVEETLGELMQVPPTDLRCHLSSLEALVARTRAVCSQREACPHSPACIIQQLPLFLLGMIWPQERVVMGMRVSAWARSQLLASRPRTLLQATSAAQTASPAVIVATLSLFRECRIVVRWHDGNDDAMVAGLVAAISSGCANALAHVDFSPGNLSGRKTSPLFAALARCTALEGLDLTSVELSLSAISKLPSALAASTQLSHLSLRDNPALSQAQPLFKLFTKCFMAGSRPDYHGTLAFLDLAECKLSDAHGRQLGAMIAENTQLTHLDLEHNRFGPQGATALADALSRCPGLKVLNMSRNEINDEGVERLAETLRTISALQSLYLSGVGMDIPGGDALALVLSGAGSALTALDVSNALFSGAPDRLLAAIGTLNTLRHLNLSCQSCTCIASLEALHKCSALTHLDLSSLDLQRDRAAELARVLPRLPLLAHLSLSVNDFLSTHGCSCRGRRSQSNLCDSCLHDSDAANRLARAFSLCTVLEELDVSDSHLPLTDMDLRPCTRLKILRLSFCAVSGEDGGMAAVAACLPELTSLLHLEVAGAGIGDAEATQMARALHRCQSLEGLNLRRNKIGDEGAAEIAQVLSMLTSLTVLDVEENKIGDAGAVSLAGGVVSCSTLESLVVKRNPMGPGLRAVLRELVPDAGSESEEEEEEEEEDL